MKRTVWFAALISIGSVSMVCAQEDKIPSDYGLAPIDEITVKHDDGSFTFREVQLIGRGVPVFKAKVTNGMNHDWDYPEFTVVYEGHDLDDPSKRVKRAFTVAGLCGWAKGRTCTLMKSLDFALFFVQKAEFKLTGGIRKMTDAESAIAAEKRRIERQEQAKRDAAQTELHNKLLQK